MIRKSGICLILSLTLLVVGCTNKVNENYAAAEYIERPKVEFLYNSNKEPVHSISDQYYNGIKIGDEDLKYIPESYDGKNFTKEQREDFERQEKELKPVIDLTERFLKGMYDINPANVEEKSNDMASISYEPMRKDYEYVIKDVKEKNIVREFVSYKIDRGTSIDVKIHEDNRVIPGKISAGTVIYINSSGEKVEDNIEIRFINIDGHWWIVSFKVFK